MDEIDFRKITSRIRRMVGQAQSLEKLLSSGDNQKFVGQLEATIAAARAILSQYAEVKLINSDSLSDQKLLARLIKKS